MVFSSCTRRGRPQSSPAAGARVDRIDRSSARRADQPKWTRTSPATLASQSVPRGASLWWRRTRVDRGLDMPDFTQALRSGPGVSPYDTPVSSSLRFVIEIVAWIAGPCALAGATGTGWAALPALLVLFGLPALFNTPGDKSSTVVATPGPFESSSRPSCWSPQSEARWSSGRLGRRSRSRSLGCSWW